MWLAAHLFVARTDASTSASVRQWLRHQCQRVAETIALWRSRSREREALRRYLHYEMKNAPSDLSRDALIESAKWFWEV